MPVSRAKLAIGSGAVAGVITASIALGWWINGNRWESRVNQIERDHAVAIQKSSERARELEHAWQINIEEVAKNARKQNDELENDLASATAAAVSLQQQVSILARKPAKCAEPASGGGADADKLLLAELFREADEVAGRMAEEADRGRIAGESCVRAYDLIRNK